MVDTRLGKRQLPVNMTLGDGRTVSFNVNFPLPDGTVMIQGPLSYYSDGIATVHSTAWMDQPAFAEARRRGMATGHRYGDELQIDWRIHTACWAASVAQHLDGDFVECGVNTGIYAAAICSFIDFAQYRDKKFYLLDTFEGLPEEQWTKDESNDLRGLNAGEFYFDSYELVSKTFAEYPNVVLVKGEVPGSLPLVRASASRF